MIFNFKKNIIQIFKILYKIYDQTELDEALILYGIALILFKFLI